MHESHDRTIAAILYYYYVLQLLRHLSDALRVSNRLRDVSFKYTPLIVYTFVLIITLVRPLYFTNRIRGIDFFLFQQRAPLAPQLKPAAIGSTRANGKKCTRLLLKSYVYYYFFYDVPTSKELVFSNRFQTVDLHRNINTYV